MSKRTCVLLGLCGVSFLLTVIALISGSDIYFTALMHGPVYSFGVLGALLIAMVLIAFSQYFGILVCGIVAFFMWAAVLMELPVGGLHRAIVICVSLVVFLGMVWRDDFDNDARIPKPSWRLPFWRSPN